MLLIRKYRPLFFGGSLLWGLVLFFAILAAAGQAAAQSGDQPPAIGWNVTFDSSVNDQAKSVAVADDGAIYVAGDSGSTGSDIWLVKYDRLGNLLWSKSYDTGVSEYVSKVTVDAAGSAYVAGIIHPGGYADELVVIKYNSAGVLQWTYTYDNGVYETVSGAVSDASGNVIIAAGSNVPTSTDDRYFIKLDSNGNFLWHKWDVSPIRDLAGDVALDSAGNIYVTGYRDDTFRTTKYDSDANVIWDHVYNPGQWDYSTEIGVDDIGNVYVGGFSTNNSSYYEAVTLKYDSSGNLLWDRRYNSGGLARPGGMAVDGMGNVYIGASKFTSFWTPAVDMRVVKYDSAGTLLWETIYASGVEEQIGSLALGPDGELVAAGWTGPDPSADFRTLRFGLAETQLMAGVVTAGELYPGDPVAIDLNIENASDLYAAQATCAVDPAVLEIQSGTFGNFFDPIDRLVGANQANAVAGTWTGAISQRSPALPLAGSGLLATLDYTAGSPGTTAITCDPLFSDQDGFTQTVVYSGTTVTILPFATISGTVTYQGRLFHAGIQASATGAVTRTAVTDDGGSFVLNQLRAGSYDIRAEAAGYLPGCTTASVTSGQALTLPGVLLKGGDTNGDEVINIGDATLIAANFGLPVPPANTQADINADSQVNIQDLALLGGNYGLAGCQTW